MFDFSAVFAAAMMGLLGLGHCLGMCGGIVSALSFASAESKGKHTWLLMFNYNLGRILSYCICAGLLTWVLASLPKMELPIARTFSGAILIALGLYFAELWRGILILEKLGQVLWSRLEFARRAAFPVNHPLKALLLGALWGWLPCGLVYSAIAYSATQSTVLGASVVMLAFGLGTMPALVIGAVAAATVKKVLCKKSVRLTFATAYILFGIWTLWGAWHHQIMHNHGPAAQQPDDSHHHHHH